MAGNKRTESDPKLAQAFKQYGKSHGERGEEPSWGPTAAKESLLRRIAKRLGLIRDDDPPPPNPPRGDVTIGPG